MRTALAIAYAGLVVIAAVMIAERRQHRDEATVPLVATRDLALNHLLLDGDLRPQSDPTQGLRGRYVLQPVGAGARVDPAALRDTPVLRQSPGHLRIELSLAPGLDPRAFNAGAAAGICHPDLAAPARATVRALRCDTAGRACTAVLDVADDRLHEAGPALARPDRATVCNP